MRDCSWSIVTTIWLQRPLPILSNNDVGSIWKGIFRLLGPPLLRSLSDICLRPKKHEQKVRPRPYNLYIRLGPFRFLISKCGWAGKKKAWRLHARLDRNRTMSRDIWYLWPQVQKKARKDYDQDGGGLLRRITSLFQSNFCPIYWFRSLGVAFCRGSGWLEFSLIICRPERYTSILSTLDARVCFALGHETRSGRDRDKHKVRTINSGNRAKIVNDTAVCYATDCNFGRQRSPSPMQRPPLTPLCHVEPQVKWDLAKILCADNRGLSIIALRIKMQLKGDKFGFFKLRQSRSAI